MISRPSELLRSIGTCCFGTITAGVGHAQNNFWAVLVGSMIGAGSVAWTFGIWLRDRTFEMQRMQISELAKIAEKLAAEIAVERSHRLMPSASDARTALDRIREPE